MVGRAAYRSDISAKERQYVREFPQGRGWFHTGLSSTFACTGILPFHLCSNRGQCQKAKVQLQILSNINPEGRVNAQWRPCVTLPGTE